MIVFDFDEKISQRTIDIHWDFLGRVLLEFTHKDKRKEDTPVITTTLSTNPASHDIPVSLSA